MKKSDAVLRAIAASHIQIGTDGRIDGPRGVPAFIFDEDNFTLAIEQAERLFDHALKYNYGPEVLYRQQATWLEVTPSRYDEVVEPMRVSFSLFHAAVHALAPFIERAPATEPERQAETRTHGFERGFGDEDGGRRALKIGDERMPLPNPPAPDITISEVARQVASDMTLASDLPGGDDPQVPQQPAPADDAETGTIDQRRNAPLPGADDGEGQGGTTYTFKAEAGDDGQRRVYDNAGNLLATYPADGQGSAGAAQEGQQAQSATDPADTDQGPAGTVQDGQQPPAEAETMNNPTDPEGEPEAAAKPGKTKRRHK